MSKQETSGAPQIPRPTSKASGAAPGGSCLLDVNQVLTRISTTRSGGLRFLVAIIRRHG